MIKKLLRNIIKARRKKRDKKFVMNSERHAFSYEAGKEFDYKKHNFSLYESVLFNLNKNDYKRYISTWEAYQPRYRLNNYQVISDDKYLFSAVFGNFIETPVNYGLINNGMIEPVAKDLRPSNLYEFGIMNKGFVIKDRRGSNGFNIYVFSCKDDKLFYRGDIVCPSKLSEIVSSFKDGLIQSVIAQGDFENSLYDKSVNTIRLITVRKENAFEHEVVAAVQRIGCNKTAPVDNFSQGGYSSIIDLETGELGPVTSCHSKDKDLNQLFYDCHPDTGEMIKGKKIPHWEDIKIKIKSITRLIPFYEFIAWDVVLKNDGIAVIEINMKSSLGVFQVHGGLRHSKLGEAYGRMGYLIRE